MKTQEICTVFRKKVFAVLTLTICLSFLIFAPVGEARATTYYVATDGNDSWPGTVVEPWETINHAAQMLVAGDTVLVRAGTYDAGSAPAWDKPAINPKNSGTAAAPITFKAYPGETVRVVASGMAIGSYWKDYIVWDGFIVDPGVLLKGETGKIKGCVVQNCVIEGKYVPTGDNHDGIRIEKTDGAVIRNCIIKNVTGDSWNSAGIKFYYNKNAVVENCEIFNCTTGIFDKDNSHNHVYRRNRIYDCSTVSILLHTQAGNPSDGAKIYENVIYNKGSISFDCDYNYSNVEVYNNVLYNPGGIGSKRSPNLRIWNNIMYTTDHAIWATYEGAPTYSDYNCIYPEAQFKTGVYTGDEKTYPTLESWQSGTGFDLNSFKKDPVFVDPANGDFHLLPGSPAIGTGLGGVDMGAYPDGGGPDPTPPYTQSHNPAPDQTNVPINTDISFHIRDAGDGVDSNSIQLTVNGQQIAQNDLQITGSSADYSVLYNPSNDFGYDSVVSVSIDAQDLHSPPNVMNTYSYSFATATESPPDSTPPYSQSHNPAPDQTNVPINTDISFHIRDAGDGVDSNSIQLTVNGQQIAQDDLQITGSSADYSVLYNPSNDFGYDSVVSVSIDAQDLHSPPNVMNTYSYSFATATESPPDSTPPYTQSHNPAPDQTNVPINTDISFHIRDAGDGVDSNSIQLTVNGQQIAQDDLQITGSSADYSVLYNPSNDFGYDSVVSVSIDAQDLHSPPNAMNTYNYSFTTAAESPPDKILFQDDFETGDLSKWIDVSRLTTTSNPQNVHSGNYALELHYPSGSEDAGWMWKKGLPTSSHNEFHIRWYHKWEDNWTWCPNDDQKFILIYGLDPVDEWGQTCDWIFYVHTTNGNPTLRLDHLIRNDAGGQWDGVWSQYPQNAGTSYEFQNGKWECIEIMIRPNTQPNLSDGALKVWINGDLKIDYSNIRIHDDDVSFNAIQISGWYKGGVPKEQYAWIDDVVVSTSYIGPVGDDSSPPSVTALDPASGTTGAPVNPNISFHVQDFGDGVDRDSIQLTVNAQQIAQSDLQITGDSADYTVVYDPPTDFGYDSVITVSIDAQDLHDAPNVMDTYTWSFTTASAPSSDTNPPFTTGHIPSPNDTGISLNTSISFHVQDSGDGVDANSILLTIKGQQIPHENLQITGSLADYAVVYDPPTDFDYNSPVTVAINAQDLHDPPNVMETYTYSFTTKGIADVENLAATTGDRQVAFSWTIPDDEDYAGVEIRCFANSDSNYDVYPRTHEEGDLVCKVDRQGNSCVHTEYNGQPLVNGYRYNYSAFSYDLHGNYGTTAHVYAIPTSSGTYTKAFGDATGGDYPGTLEDTFLNVNEDNASTFELLNTYTWPQDQIANAILMKWDLSAIPSSATIQNATLYLYMSDVDGGGGDDLYDLPVHKIINYNPVISACTGYAYDGTNLWTPNSQCYDNIPLAQADIARAEDTKSIDKTYGYKSWSVTNMAQDWVSNSASNYGMLVNSDLVASSDSNRSFSSTESPNPDQRPKLVVTYIVGEGPDTTDPTVTITQPTSEDTYHTQEDSVTLVGGSTSDNVGVTSVTWENDRGGSGTASGTSNWTISAIPLHCGDDNIITVTAKDAAGNSGTDTLTIDVRPCPVSGMH